MFNFIAKYTFDITDLVEKYSFFYILSFQVVKSYLTSQKVFNLRLRDLLKS